MIRAVLVAWLTVAALNRPALGTQLWFDNAGLTSQALALLDAMRIADELGLEPRDYDAARILSESRQADSPSRRASADTSLSIAARRFVSHLHYGRVDPKTVGFEMPPRTQAFDANAVLAELASTDATRGVLASIEPPFQHYAFLKTQLAHYRRLAERPELTRLPVLQGTSVAVGEDYAGAPALRELLIAVGDLPPALAAPSTNLTLDPNLVAALWSFQFRHGLPQDGKLGKRTYAALTTPFSTRVRQIKLTLERWRWLPALDAPTIIVNIPQFRLFAFSSNSDRESQMVTMDVIVGQTYPRTRTPVFAADLKYVVFRPFWDVPYNIMRREMLPAIRRGGDYLAAHDLEVVSGAGVTQHPTPAQIDALATGKLRVRQRPGPRNSLGLVKFMLPNSHNVYLHATPARELFKESRRAFSHGCIRVSDPVALGEYVLRNALGEWPREKIEAAMQGTEALRVDLKQWINVRIVYGTAVATEKGLIYFFEDLYGNDERLAQILGLK